jgi:hypothetical protein
VTLSVLRGEHATACTVCMWPGARRLPGVFLRREEPAAESPCGEHDASTGSYSRQYIRFHDTMFTVDEPIRLGCNLSRRGSCQKSASCPSQISRRGSSNLPRATLPIMRRRAVDRAKFQCWAQSKGVDWTIRYFYVLGWHRRRIAGASRLGHGVVARVIRLGLAGMRCNRQRSV